jgi:hypothetical protein
MYTTLLTVSGREMAFTNLKPLQYKFTSTVIHLHRVECYKIVAERSKAQGDVFTHQKPPQFRFTSPSIHLRRVGYYKTIAERSEAQGYGIYTSKAIAI